MVLPIVHSCRYNYAICDFLCLASSLSIIIFQLPPCCSMLSALQQKNIPFHRYNIICLSIIHEHLVPIQFIGYHDCDLCYQHSCTNFEYPFQFFWYILGIRFLGHRILFNFLRSNQTLFHICILFFTFPPLIT